MRKSPRKGAATLGFWTAVALICVGVALLSYQLGKNWVGKQLETAVLGRQVGFRTQQGSGPPAQSTTGPAQQLPPGSIKVELEPRAPGEAEKNDLAAEALGDIGESGGAATSERSATPEAAAAPTSGYTVTAGSYTSAATAQRARADLESRGYHPYITDFENRGITYHRVVVGVYGNRERADKVRGEVERAGYAAGITGP